VLINKCFCRPALLPAVLLVALRHSPGTRRVADSGGPRQRAGAGTGRRRGAHPLLRGPGPAVRCAPGDPAPHLWFPLLLSALLPRDQCQCRGQCWRVSEHLPGLRAHRIRRGRGQAADPLCCGHRQQQVAHCSDCRESARSVRCGKCDYLCEGGGGQGGGGSVGGGAVAAAGGGGVPGRQRRLSCGGRARGGSLLGGCEGRPGRGAGAFPLRAVQGGQERAGEGC
jgi:hypothetical protein